MLVVAYQGAAHAPDTVTRDKAAAAVRAGELLAKVSAGADFGTLARSESDAPSSAARDGIMGTHRKDAWPPTHAALRDPLFSLPVGATAPQPLEADYGYVLLQRCPVEKARSRHILVRYKGAKNADKSIKRSRARAEAQAQALLTKVQGGADFAALAKAESDDSSKERGGDVGLKGRGLLAPAYDRALFSMGKSASSRWSRPTSVSTSSSVSRTTARSRERRGAPPKVVGLPRSPAPKNGLAANLDSPTPAAIFPARIPE
jgi:parvulin-like peptidyl-prolyl isomerase